MGLVNKPYDFEERTPAEADEVNANFDILYNLVNGQLDQNNIANGAITTSKIADKAVTKDKLNFDDFPNLTITGDLAVQGDTDLNNLIVSGTADLSGAEVLLPDTGWTSLPLASGFNGTGVGGSYPPQYRKINNVVYMRGIVAKNSGNITTSTPPFATLPASIRPLTKNVYFDRPCGATGNMARLEFDSNGVCYIVYVSGSGTYLMLDGINYPL